MNFEKFTIKSREAIQESGRIAIEAGNPEIAPVHLAAVLLDDQDSVISGVLNSLELNQRSIRDEIAGMLSSLPRTKGGSEPRMSANLTRILGAAEKFAAKMKDEYVAREHLFLGLLGSGGRVADMLHSKGVTEKAFLEAMASVRGSFRISSESAEDSYKALEKYSNESMHIHTQDNKSFNQPNNYANSYHASNDATDKPPVNRFGDCRWHHRWYYLFFNYKCLSKTTNIHRVSASHIRSCGKGYLLAGTTS